jgi:hypothetical protein
MTENGPILILMIALISMPLVSAVVSDSGTNRTLLSMSGGMNHQKCSPRIISTKEDYTEYYFDQ